MCVVGLARGVTLLHDVVYIVCQSSSAIIRFSARTHERLTDINVEGMRYPREIAACEQTSQLYVTDIQVCIWRVLSEGEDIRRWWTQTPPDTFAPHTLSVTSSRLLVTSQYTQQLMQLDAAGEELQRFSLPDHMEYLSHAVESPAGTFVIAHKNTQLMQWQVSEVNTEGEVLHQFSRPHSYAKHIALDSQGNIFLADCYSCHILQLDAQLALCRVIIDKHQLNNKEPRRLCYNAQSGQLMVGLDFIGNDDTRSVVAVFDVLQR